MLTACLQLQSTEIGEAMNHTAVFIHEKPSPSLRTVGTITIEAVTKETAVSSYNDISNSAPYTNFTTTPASLILPTQRTWIINGSSTVACNYNTEVKEDHTMTTQTHRSVTFYRNVSSVVWYISLLHYLL